jgi:hypothetical protein
MRSLSLFYVHATHKTRLDFIWCKQKLPLCYLISIEALVRRTIGHSDALNFGLLNVSFWDSHFIATNHEKLHGSMNSEFTHLKPRRNPVRSTRIDARNTSESTNKKPRDITVSSERKVCEPWYVDGTNSWDWLYEP